MDMRRITSVGRYTQSMGTKEICILVVNKDHTCRKIVAYMLEHCSYEVFNSERAIDALSVIWERKEKLGVVLTNVHRTDANEFGIIERIEKECKLQIILMSPDDDGKIATNGLGIGFTIYIVKSLSMNEINSLWADALASDKAKVVTIEAAGIDQEELPFENLVMGDLGHESLVGDQASWGYGKLKRKEIRERSEETEGSKHDSTVSKKPRVIWTTEMHQKFLEAISQLGHDNAFPKKIVEIMNVPGLTRENVASHLQKYRLCLRRAREEHVSLLYGRNSINDVKSPYFSARNFQRSSQQSCWTRFQQLREAILSPSNIHGGFNSEESKVRPPQSLPLSFQKTFLHPENQTLTFSDAAAKHNAEGNFRMYSDQTKNVLLSCNVNRHFIGFRLAGDGKSLEFGHPSSSGENGTPNKMVLSPAKGDSSAWFASRSNNSIPLQLQQQSLPTSEGAKNEDIALWGDVNDSFDWSPSIPNGNENSGQYPLYPTSFVAQPLDIDENDDSYLYQSAFADDIMPNQPPPLEESSFPPPPLLQFQGIDYFGGEDDFLMQNNTGSFSEYFADFLHNPHD